MTWLLIEPLVERGMRLRLVSEKSVWKKTVEIAAGEDVVVAIDRILRGVHECTEIIIRTNIGSFSASRSALVAASVLSATRGIPYTMVSASLETPDDVRRARAHATTKKFSYAHPPHIT